MIMRKTFFLFALLCSVYIKAQTFIGGFWYDKPDAITNKEIYFYCQNNAVNYYGYGQDLSNVVFVVEDNDGNCYRFDVDGMWVYKNFIVINSSKFSFRKGNRVHLYWSNSYMASWTCDISHKITLEELGSRYQSRPHRPPKINWKKVTKIIKRIKR